MLVPFNIYLYPTNNRFNSNSILHILVCSYKYFSHSKLLVAFYIWPLATKVCTVIIVMTQKNMSLNVRLMSVPFWINTWKKIFILIFIILFVIKYIIVTEIHDWDSNTSLDLKVYIKPNQKSYIVQPKLSKIS